MYNIKKVKRLIIMILFITLMICIPHKIKAVTILLDPGHGGKDTGAINETNNIYEKDINLKVAKYVKEYLEDYQDVTILLTREDDTFLEIFDRGIMAREKNVDLFISMHFNSNENGGVKGAEVYVSNNTSLPKYKEETTKIGNKILDNLNKLGIENRGVRTRLISTDTTDVYSDGTIADYYGVIRYAMRGCKIDSGVIKPEGAIPAKVEDGEGIPALIIEHCYMNSDTDYDFYDTDEDLKKLAEADAKALIEYYSLKKKETRNFKIKEEKIFVQYNTTIDEIKKYFNLVKVNENFNMITGENITLGEENFKVIKIGDCTGDGEISPADYVWIKNHIMKVMTLEGDYLFAADINEDNEITPSDYVRVKNHIMNVTKIEITEEI